MAAADIWFSDLYLFGHFKGVVDLNAKISDGTFQLGAPKQ